MQSIIPDIVAEMNCLLVNFHRDSVDRLIVVIARFLKLSLAIKDRKIRDSRLTTLWQL
jgi:PIN domain nuclease of toxin-antitoxin system